MMVLANMEEASLELFDLPRDGIQIILKFTNILELIGYLTRA